MDKNLIRVSKSPFGAAVFFVQKKDGSLRLVTNYWALNAVTIKNRYPLPLISELLDQLSGASIFSKIDLTAGYNQVRVANNDITKTAFRTKYIAYKSVVMNFGMTNAPSTFVTLMNLVFRSLIGKSVVIYLDNIIVFSKSKAQHKVDLRNVLNILCDNQLYAKPSKCQFYEKSLTFLGHIISASGIKPNPEKIKAIVELPRPTNILGLQSFLGLVAFVRKFIPNCSKLIAPLTALLKKGVKFKWNFEREENL